MVLTHFVWQTCLERCLISGGDWLGSLVLLKYFYANHLCWLFFVAQDLLFLHSEFYINAEIVVDAVLRYGINHCEAYSRVGVWLTIVDLSLLCIV